MAFRIDRVAITEPFGRWKIASFVPAFGLGTFLAIFGFALAAEVPPNIAAELRSVEFSRREAAQSALLKWGRADGEPALLWLLEQSRTADDPEARARCLQVVRELVYEQYMKEGEGYIGIGMEDVVINLPNDPNPCHAIRVSDLMAGMPGANAGVHVGDVIVSLDGNFWRDAEASVVFRERIRTFKPSSTVTLGVLREGKVEKIQVMLVRRPVAADTQFLMQRNLLPENPGFDPAALERAAKEAYFRQWLAQRKSAK